MSRRNTLEGKAARRKAKARRKLAFLERNGPIPYLPRKDNDKYGRARLEEAKERDS
jgi:hypothetical protein